MEHKSFVRKEVKPEVLIVDDQEINRDILEAIIEDEFTPLLCADGAQALETIAARRDTVSLVLLDLHMPGLSGQDVLRTLKDDPDLRKIPVIVMTGEQDAEVECLELGASDFISKSTPNSKVILARIRRTVELYQDRQIIEDTERDPVTGLYTREYFFRYAEQFDMLHKELDMDAALVDVNHFHMINE
ncbi:MAG: response regulator, partial [Desulfovibrio sp.]|nr:response regulator [Desulfovibrio sp.]